MSRTALGLQIIASEIKNDPAGLGYAGKSALEIVALANTPRQVGILQGPVYTPALLQWLASGPMQQISDYAANAANNPALRSVCLAGLRMVGCVEFFDTGQSENQSFLAALVAGGVVTQAQSDALMALGQTPMTQARSVTVLGDTWSADDVSSALALGG